MQTLAHKVETNYSHLPLSLSYIEREFPPKFWCYHIDKFHSGWILVVDYSQIGVVIFGLTLMIFPADNMVDLLYVNRTTTLHQCQTLNHVIFWNQIKCELCSALFDSDQLVYADCQGPLEATFVQIRTVLKGDFPVVALRLKMSDQTHHQNEGLSWNYMALVIHTHDCQSPCGRF